MSEEVVSCGNVDGMALMDERTKKLLSFGSEIAGAAVGGALGFLAGGPVGAAGGNAFGVTAAKLLQEFSHRILSRREEVRVGATAAHAIDYIRRQLETGRTLRNDEFFAERSTGMSLAQEIFEGVLVKAKNDHEEKKAHFYGTLFGNVAFDIHCSAHEANYLLQVMDRLTYLQLILLNIFSDTSRFELRSTRFQPGEQVTFEMLSILSAIFYLFTQGLLRQQEPGRTHGEIILEMNHIRPAHTTVTASGKRIFHLAGLAEIAQVDIDPVIRLLSEPARGDAAPS